MSLISIWLYIAIILIALFGLWIAGYLRWTKIKKKKEMVCPLDMDCDSVIHSEYSYFLGIPVEFLGMVYYVAVAGIYGYLLSVQADAPDFLVFSILIATIAAVIFSAYLTAIQAWILRMWCTWCLISAGLCVLIFASALWASGMGIIEILAIHIPHLSLGYIFGLALGVGGSTMAMVFLIKAVGDSKITPSEASTLRTAWQSLWFALAIVLIGGVGLSAVFYERVTEMSVIYLFEILAILILIILSVAINFFIIPKIFAQTQKGRDDKEFSSLEEYEKENHQYQIFRGHLRKNSFVLGTVLAITWYSLLLVSIARLFEGINVPEGVFVIAGYLIVVAIGIVVALLMNKSLKRKEEDI